MNAQKGRAAPFCLSVIHICGGGGGGGVCVCGCIFVDICMCLSGGEGQHIPVPFTLLENALLDLLLMDSFGWGDAGGFTIVNCVLLVESPMSPLSLSPPRGPRGRQPRMPSGVSP